MNSYISERYSSRIQIIVIDKMGKIFAAAISGIEYRNDRIRGGLLEWGINTACPELGKHIIKSMKYHLNQRICRNCIGNPRARKTTYCALWLIGGGMAGGIKDFENSLNRTDLSGRSAF